MLLGLMLLFFGLGVRYDGLDHLKYREKHIPVIPGTLWFYLTLHYVAYHRERISIIGIYKGVCDEMVR